MTATPKRKSRKATKARPSPVVVLTPNTKKAKKVMDTAILKAAAMDVLRLRNGEGTRAIYGSMNRVIARYQSHQTLGHVVVTRGKMGMTWIVVVDLCWVSVSKWWICAGYPCQNGTVHVAVSST
jgi:hypothetical protein